MQAFPSETRTARMPGGLVAALRPLDVRAPSVAAWRALARTSLVENLFYEPDFALAGAEAFGAGVNLLTVGTAAPEDPDARLLALWPCRIVHRWGVPIPALIGWMHSFSIFGAPLIDRSAPAEALAALLDAPRALRLPRRLLFTYLPLDGPFADLLDANLAERGAESAPFWAHERAFLDLAARDETQRAAYLDTRLSRRRRRQLERFRRRLEREAPVGVECLQAPDALKPALDDFIALERSGWKGRDGTAVYHRPEEVAFLKRLVTVYGAQGRARIDRLRRDGHSLAASIGFETDNTFWYLKIAHDEAEARNSPGVQLIGAVTRTLLDDPRLAAADSCAPPSLAAIGTVWAERRRLAHRLVEAGGGDPLFPLAARLERLRSSLVRLREARAGR